MSKTYNLKPGETVISEDAETIVTRTIETRQISDPHQQPITLTTITTPSTIHSPSRLTPVVLTSDPQISQVRRDQTVRPFGNPVSFIENFPEHKPVENSYSSSNRVILSPSRVFTSSSNQPQVSTSYLRQAPTTTYRTYGSPLIQTPQVTTTLRQVAPQNMNTITTETITTRKKNPPQPTSITVQAPDQKQDESLLKFYREEIERLSRKVDQLQNTINQLNEANAKVFVLEKSNIDLTHKNSRLEDDLAKLKTENENLRVSLAVRENSIMQTPAREDSGYNYMQNQLDKLESEISRLRKEKQSTEEENLELKANNMKLTLKIEKQGLDLEDSVSKLKSFQETLAQKEQEQKSLQREIESIQRLSQQGELSQNLAESLSKNKALSDKLEEERARNIELSHKVETLKLEHISNTRLLADHEEKRLMFDRLKDELTKQTTQNTILMNKIEDLSRRSHDQNHMEINQKLIEEFEEKTGEYLGKIQELENLINSQDGEKKDILEENDLLKSEFLLLEREYERLKAESDKSGTLALLKEENESLKRINEQLRSEMDFRRGSNRGPSNEFSELSKKLSDLETRMSRDSSTLELGDLKSRNKDLELKIRQYEKKEDKWNQLGKDLAQIKSEFQQDKFMILTLTRDKSDLEAKLKSTENENLQKQQLIDSLEMEVDEWGNKCMHLEKKLEYDDDDNRNLHFIEEIEALKQMGEEKEEELDI